MFPIVENVSLNLGILTVEAKPAVAFEGFAKRVHPTEAAAIIDIASNTLAQRWLDKDGRGKPPFASFLEMLACDIELSEAALNLARYKKSHQRTL